MPRILLTRSFVQSAACPAGRRKLDYFDKRCPGFLLEVRVSGGKTFYQRYRDAHGRERQYKIGPAAILSVAEAREKARRIAAEALIGADPQDRRQAQRQMPTLREFATESYLPFVKTAKRSWRTDETVLRLHILPALGRLPLDEVAGPAIAALMQRLRLKGYASGTTNRVVVLIKYIFNLAKKWGITGLGDNPASGLRTEPDVQRERFLSEEEVGRLIRALDTDENQVAAQAIRLLLLTGGRRNEITQARWDYIDWEKRTLFVPLSKAGRPRAITLSSAAIELLRAIAPVPNNPYVFPSPITGRPSPSMHFPWRRIRAAAGLSGVRLHDLRHSFASFLVNKGVSLYVVQGLLGHTQPRMTQRYAHLAQKTLADAADVVGGILDRGDRAADTLSRLRVPLPPQAAAGPISPS